MAIDSRCSRRLTAGAAPIIDAAEWAWVRGRSWRRRDRRPPLLATTLPSSCCTASTTLEGCDEAVAEGAWGRRRRPVAEALRQAADLEHWAAFRRSFAELVPAG